VSESQTLPEFAFAGGHGYNRIVKGIALTVLAAVILLSGCRKNIQNKDAVRKAVVEYLAKRNDLMAMDVAVSAVTFKDNQADALVYLTAKGGLAAGSGMQMRYALERQGDKWVVKPRGGTSPHTGAGAMGMPPVTGGEALPQGHPQLPPAPPGPAK
jgi:hypothetical protein